MVWISTENESKESKVFWHFCCKSECFFVFRRGFLSVQPAPLILHPLPWHLYASSQRREAVWTRKRSSFTFALAVGHARCVCLACWKRFIELLGQRSSNPTNLKSKWRSMRIETYNVALACFEQNGWIILTGFMKRRLQTENGSLQESCPSARCAMFEREMVSQVSGPQILRFLVEDSFRVKLLSQAFSQRLVSTTPSPNVQPTYISEDPNEGTGCHTWGCFLFSRVSGAHVFDELSAMYSNPTTSPCPGSFSLEIISTIVLVFVMCYL